MPTLKPFWAWPVSAPLVTNAKYFTPCSICAVMLHTVALIPTYVAEIGPLDRALMEQGKGNGRLQE